jgi:hypothetical protein
VFALLGVLVAFAACTGQARPEGIVERWLLSLNQGAAGRPDAYASDEVSQQVVPGWEDLDPGELDVIEVGRSAPGEGGIDQVPFRVVTIDDDELRGLANVQDDRVTAILTTAQTPVGPLPSEGGRSSHDPVHAAGWLAALAVAGTLIACTWGLMALVRRRSAPTDE